LDMKDTVGDVETFEAIDEVTRTRDLVGPSNHDGRSNWRLRKV
jgi:hypothetical protein